MFMIDKLFADGKSIYIHKPTSKENYLAIAITEVNGQKILHFSIFRYNPG